MTVRRVAMLSVHTSPLDQPGSGDGGGLNVYVDALARSLAGAGVACDVLTRVSRPDQTRVVELAPGVRVVHLDGGPHRAVPKGRLVEHVDELAASAVAWIEREGVEYDALHANYWISGAVAHALKHELGVPLIATFHTLARVKAAAGVHDDPEIRDEVEAAVVRCADRLLASTTRERDDLVREYDADPALVEVIAPGVDHRLFSPDDRGAARRRLGLAPGPLLLCVGRIQALKGFALAVRALGALDRPDARLVIVGGPSGPEGDAEAREILEVAARTGVADRVTLVPPVAHDRLADYYRAADLCLVPSRTESFGLVALEAAACGTPVVAAAVGGLRELVDHRETGFLVEEREPRAFAAGVSEVLSDATRRDRMGAQAAARSARFSWSMAAARLRRVYADASARDLVQCR